MKTLVSGGAGFIGSHLVDALVGAGTETVVVDDLSSGSEKNLNPEARFYRVSIADSALDGVLERERPDAIVHMAAQTVVTRSVADPVYDAGINILGSLNLLACAARRGVKRVVYASSCALYGKPQFLPIDESHRVSPISPYGISKHTVEHYLQLYRELYGIGYIALRYANVYGPRQNPSGEGGVVAIFSGKMLAGEQPVIYGSGDKCRDYIYVADVVGANVLALNSQKSGIFNIGTGVETTDGKVFDTVSGLCRYTGEPRYAPERPGEIRRIYLDSNRAANELGWFPLVRFEEGVRNTVEYYRSELDKVKV